MFERTTPFKRREKHPTDTNTQTNGSATNHQVTAQHTGNPITINITFGNENTIVTGEKNKTIVKPKGVKIFAYTTIIASFIAIVYFLFIK